LLSIHNNALPDGRDPWKARGSSAYWYQVQSMDLARTLKASLIAVLDFPDYGLFYDNLALTRPSNMLACLVEVGFMINPDEYAELITEDTQAKAAAGLANGIEKYILTK